MTRRYLLDTNILSSLIKKPDSPIAHKMFDLDREVFCTSIVVACELRYGVKKKGSDKLQKKVELLLQQIDVLPLRKEVSHHYATIRTVLERAGQPIGSNDLLIAAHARSLNLVLVTANVREFSRVPDLIVENWTSTN